MGDHEPDRPRRGARTRIEALQAAGLVVAFLAFGVGWAALEGQASPSAAVYPPPAVGSGSGSDAAEIWLVDGFNVLHAGVLGGRDRSDWWTRDRREELLARAAGFDDPRAEVWVVFDGPHPAPESHGAGCGRVRGVFAPSADDWLLAQVRERPEPARLRVVTADRRLAGRLRHRGARVVSPAAFLSRCTPAPG